MSWRLSAHIGLDYAIDDDGQFWLIEVNNSPAWPRVAELSDDVKGSAGHRTLSNILQGVDRIAYLHSERVRHWDGVFISDPLEAFLAFVEWLAPGRSSFVTFFNESSAPEPRLSPSDLVIVRSVRPILGSETKLMLNHPVCRAICRDKLRLPGLLKAAGHRWVLPAFDEPSSALQACPDFSHFVLKPRFGYGSIGIEKVERSNITKTRVDYSNYILQPLVDVDTILGERHRYHYDVRVVITFGDLSNASLRISGIPAYQPDAWITTTGRNVVFLHPPSQAPKLATAWDGLVEHAKDVANQVESIALSRLNSPIEIIDPFLAKRTSGQWS